MFRGLVATPTLPRRYLIAYLERAYNRGMQTKLDSEYAKRRRRYMSSTDKLLASADWQAVQSATHDKFYEWLADAIGIQVSDLPVSLEEISDHLVWDRHLNGIPLRLWDWRHGLVEMRARKAGKTSWSLCDTTCVLKAFARREALKLPRT